MCDINDGKSFSVCMNECSSGDAIHKHEKFPLSIFLDKQIFFPSDLVTKYSYNVSNFLYNGIYNVSIVSKV